jgi:hypothetical protein
MPEKLSLGRVETVIVNATAESIEARFKQQELDRMKRDLDTTLDRERQRDLQTAIKQRQDEIKETQDRENKRRWAEDAKNAEARAKQQKIARETTAIVKWTEGEAEKQKKKQKPQAPLPPLPQQRVPQVRPRAGGRGLPGLPLIPSVAGNQYKDATTSLLGTDYVNPYFGNDPLSSALRIKDSVVNSMMSGFVRVTPISAIINAVSDELGSQKAKSANAKGPNLLTGKVEVTNEQIATLLQDIQKSILAVNATVDVHTQILKALAAQSDLAIEGIKGTLVGVSAIPAIGGMTADIRRKVGTANFTLQNQAAQLTKQKLPTIDKIATNVTAINAKLPKNGIFQIDKTGVANVVKAALTPSFQAIDGKLPKNGIFRVDQTGIANTVKAKLDPSFKAIDGKLPDNGIFRVDQTGIANTVKAKLDPSFQAIDGKLPKNGIFRVDQTGVATVVKAALAPSFLAIEAKLPPSNIAQLTRIETKLSQPLPVAIPADLARKADIANIRFPPQVLSPAANLGPITAQLTRLETKLSQPLPVAIPADLARKSDLNPLAQQLVGLRQVTDINNQAHNVTHGKLEQLTPLLVGIPAAIGSLAILRNIQANTNRLPAMETAINTIKQTKDKVTSVTVKVWDSTRKAMGSQRITVPEAQAEATQLLANESAEAQEDSHKERTGIKDTLKKIADRLQIVRILTIMGNVASLHNAAMLSKNLGESLGDLTGTVLTKVSQWTGVISPTDTINVNELLGAAFNDFMKDALGETTWNGTKASFNRANRILTSASAIVYNIRSIADSTRSLGEFTANNLGRVGNALKKWGVVGENAYPFMSTNVTARTAFQAKMDKVREGVESLDDTVGALSAVAGDVISIEQEFNEGVKNVQDLTKSLTDNEPKPAAENKPAKDAATAAKVASAGKELDSVDIAISGEEA